MQEGVEAERRNLVVAVSRRVRVVGDSRRVLVAIDSVRDAEHSARLRVGQVVHRRTAHGELDADGVGRSERKRVFASHAQTVASLLQCSFTGSDAPHLSILECFIYNV